ncbi:MAG: hypothetical protein COB02_16710 [Candidatus Cloacimonadota bacterium]|nr:MAG: hypothetical protein COB02_16710 [Candidatus Cloacimonadota bacterium]
MKKKIIISDTGPLISLEKLDKGLEFLSMVYEEIIIPQAVFDELSEKEEKLYKKLRFSGDIKVVKVETIENIPDVSFLDLGEIEAISLAFQMKVDLLIEEKAGRLSAIRMGINRSGIGGVILKAFREKIISKKDASKKLQTLKEKGRLDKTSYSTLIVNIEKI